MPIMNHKKGQSQSQANGVSLVYSNTIIKQVQHGHGLP